MLLCERSLIAHFFLFIFCFLVPADWCAPLGCETVTKLEEVVCPSVRLRQLYIPLQPVHLTKQEVCAFELFLFERTNEIDLQKLIESIHGHEI